MLLDLTGTFGIWFEGRDLSVYQKLCGGLDLTVWRGGNLPSTQRDE